MKSPPQALYVVLKLAEVCNLDCTYCYFFNAGDESYQDNPRVISRLTVEGVARFLAQGVRDLGLSRIDISFHGGEPLLVGKKRFAEICDVLLAWLSPLCAVKFSLQTNGTLIDREWVDLFAAYEVGIGVSLDGPEDVNDAVRVDHKGRGSHARVKQGLRWLRQGTEAGLIPGYAVNVVISDGLDAEKLFSHFVDDLQISYFDVVPQIMDYRTQDERRALAVGEFYRELVRVWVERGDPTIRIGALSEIFGALLSDEGMQARWRAVSSYTPTFTIRSSGVLCPDDALAHKDSKFAETGMDVFATSLRDFLSADSWEPLLAAYEQVPADCTSCRWLGVCAGGIAENRFSPEGHFRRKSTYCRSQQALFTSVEEALLQYIPIEELNRRTAVSLSDGQVCAA